MLLLSRYNDNFYSILLGVAIVAKVFKHFCTYALMKIFVSAAFFISFSRRISIYGSICFPINWVNSHRQIKLFFETLDLKFSTIIVISRTRECIVGDGESVINYGWNYINLLSLFIASNWTFQSPLFISCIIFLIYLSGSLKGFKSSFDR